MNQDPHTRIRTFEAAHPKRVSYVLATKNRSGFLESALARSREFVGPEDELLVIDGGSADRTAEVVNSFGSLVSVFLSEPDSNAYEASNKGIMLARGKFVCTISDDDTIHPGAMREAIEVLEKNPEIDILLCGGTKQFGSGSTFVFYVPPGANYGHRPEDTVIYGATGSGLIVRRCVFAKIGLPDGLAADGELVTKGIARGCQVRFCRIKLFHQTIYNHSVTRSKKYLHRKHQFEYIKRYCSRPFYWKYRITRMFKDSPLNASFSRLRRFVRVRITGRRARAHDIESGLMWDGGFS